MRKSITVTVILILVLMGCLVYFRIIHWHKEGIEEVKRTEEERWSGKIFSLENMVTQLQTELERQEGTVPEEKLLEIFGDKPTIFTHEEGDVQCEGLKRQILALFSYLDQSEYFQSYDFKGGIHEFMQGTVQKLSQNKPIVSGETRNLYKLIKNTAHFYRVLGKRRVELIQHILANESDILEHTSALFYEWFAHGNRCEDSLGIRPSDRIMYEYAGFFLNTLAGRSYLLRRESRLSTLVGYYSILIIHSANERSQNVHGIDIRPYIVRLLDTLSTQRGFVHRKDYLKKMKELRDSYLIR